MIYCIGSLKLPPHEVSNTLRLDGHEVFDDWSSPGPNADDHWRDYEKQRGRTFLEALDGWAAKHIFEFDKTHLDRCDVAVAVMPCGKSAMLELAYVMWFRKKPGFLLLDNPERWDVMFQFVSNPTLNPGGGVFDDIEALRSALGAFLGPLRDAPSEAACPSLRPPRDSARRIYPLAGFDVV